jgi:hypothetical protein
MPVAQPITPQPRSINEFTTQAANAAHLIAEGAERGEEARKRPGQSLEPMEAAEAQDEASSHREPPQTREAYLKKGEDLIRSLL